ncbi:MAG: hypothetical protein U1F17_15775 [Burkholderiaceae bacterium]|jgi:hypothetical protein
MRPACIVLAWLGWSAVLLVAEVLAVPLVPLAVALADPAGRLPPCFRWLETHDQPGWQGPLSEGYPATRWGLIRWLWRNRAYRLSNTWRCSPDFETMVLRERGTRDPRTNPPAWWLGTIADGRRWWFELTAAARLAGVDVELRAGWKLAPFFEGARPGDFTATPIGMQVLSVRTMRAR